MKTSPSRLFIVAMMFAASIASGPSWAKDVELRRVPAKLDVSTLKAVDLNGQPWSAADLRGKVIVLNFCASWCAPCIDELPYLNDLAGSEFAKGKVAVVGVDFKEPADTVRRFASERKLGYPVVIDKTGDQFRKWTSGVLPTTVIVDQHGRARWRIIGEIDRTDKALKQKLEKLLAEPKPGAKAPTKNPILKQEKK